MRKKIIRTAGFVIILSALLICEVPVYASKTASVLDDTVTNQVSVNSNLKKKGVLVSVNSLEKNLKDTTSSVTVTDKIQLSAGASSVIEGKLELTDLNMENVGPITFWGYTNIGIANVDNHLNVREVPETNGKLVGKMSNNAACEILAIENGWAKIISGKVEGYVSTDFLLTGYEAIARAKEVVSTVAIVNTDALLVREEPNTECAVVTYVQQGEELEVVEAEVSDCEGNWVKILVDDEEAYVCGDYVIVEEKLSDAITMTELLYGVGVSDVRVDLCQYAQEFVGNKYVWGGTSLTKGADCSGFVLSVFKKYGFTLPHSSKTQSTMGIKKTMETIEPGDLIFYGKGKSVNHVAIYIGNGQVVHASSAKTGIKISSASYRTPLAIRDIIQD